MMRKALLFAFLALLPMRAVAQTCPTQNIPNFQGGGMLWGASAFQVNTYFGAKVDLTNGCSYNQTLYYPNIIGPISPTPPYSAGTGIVLTGTVFSADFGTASGKVVQGGILGSSGGPIGSATVVPIISYNAAGQITAISFATIAPPFSAITSTPTTLAGYGIPSPLPVNVGGSGSTTAAAARTAFGLDQTSNALLTGGGAGQPYNSITTGANVVTLLGGTASGTGGPAGTISPAFTGNPSAPTQTSTDNSTKVATTAFVQSHGGGSSNGNQVSETGPYTITTDPNGTYFDNTGATTPVPYTLPAYSAGLHFCFTVTVNQILEVIAPSGAFIAIGSSISASGGNISADLPFSTACLIASTKSGYWFVDRSISGSNWTVN